MSQIIAFAGPSVTDADRMNYPVVDWLPPAQAGDILRLAGSACRTVCLIDGYFDHRPAVRHKELLLLLSRGIRIIGASSIGALRAAEMRGFGMEGVGAVFHAYARGLEGDDEVALVHAPERWRWRPLSEPLVDIRANLHTATRTGAISGEEARRVMSAAREIHYAEREWGPVVEKALLSGAARTRFEGWLKKFGFSQKRLDALQCIQAACSKPPPAGARPEMVWTTYVHALARQTGAGIEAGPAVDHA